MWYYYITLSFGVFVSMCYLCVLIWCMSGYDYASSYYIQKVEEVVKLAKELVDSLKPFELGNTLDKVKEQKQQCEVGFHICLHKLNAIVD